RDFLIRQDLSLDRLEDRLRLRAETVIRRDSEGPPVHGVLGAYTHAAWPGELSAPTCPPGPIIRVLSAETGPPDLGVAEHGLPPLAFARHLFSAGGHHRLGLVKGKRAGSASDHRARHRQYSGLGLL